MKSSRKPRADSKLKTLPDESQEAMWALLHPQDKDTQAWTLEAVGAHVAETHGFTVSLSTLSDWHSWYALRRRMEAASAMARQTAMELAANPDMSPDYIDRVAQTVFAAETLERRDIKGYTAIARLRQTDKSLDQRDQQLKQRDQELVQREKLVAQSERRVAVLEKKAAFADAVKKAAENSEGGITAEQMAEIERKLKMM
jgi:hypothetical protein